MKFRGIMAVSLAAVISIVGIRPVLEGKKYPVKSDVIELAARSEFVQAASTLLITEQPADQTVKRGSSITISVLATGEGLQYQWYYKKKEQTSFSVWKGHANAKETAASNDTWDGIQFYCVIKDSAGHTVQSDVATITFAGEIRITEQPQSRCIQTGEKITLSVKATGDGLSYRWFFKKIGQSSFSVWKNHIAASETVLPNETWNGIQLYCEISDKFGNKLNSDIAVVTFRQNESDEKPWQGLKLSVLGDSISTYKGWSENNTYYTPSKIPSVNSMWWKQVCDRLGAEPLVIEARASSCCAVSNVSWTKDITPAVDDTRCTNLHKGNTDPDIIMIAMGVNDFQANVPLGNWDGHSELSSDDTGTWRGAYANTIRKIHQRYPYALVFCLSPWYFVRGNCTTVNVNKHGTYQDYEDAMREVCELLQCVYIDSNNFGFNRQNYNPQTFAIDDKMSDGSIFHPNAVGQEILGQSVAAEVESKSVGYINWLKQRG